MGSSSDLRNLLNDHQNGKVRSTASKLPVELVYYEAYKTVDQARNREKEIRAKRYEKEKIIDRLKHH